MLPPEDKFYMEIGLTITRWADLEEALFELCKLALGAPEAQAAVVFYRTPSLEGRIRLTSRP
jgi:hypothetical protein